MYLNVSARLLEYVVSLTRYAIYASPQTGLPACALPAAAETARPERVHETAGISRTAQVMIAVASCVPAGRSIGILCQLVPLRTSRL